jgi:hypothetical protein
MPSKPARAEIVASRGSVVIDHAFEHSDNTFCLSLCCAWAVSFACICTRIDESFF